MINTLDRFLVPRRRPGETANAEERYGEAEMEEVEATAEEGPAEAAPQAEGAEAEGAEAEGDRRGGSGTLFAYLTRRDATAEASTSGRLGDVTLWRHPLPASLLARQLAGQLDGGALAHARRAAAAQMQQLACVGTHSWGRAALSALGAVVLPCEGGEGRAWLQDVRFDSGGELLVAASSEGLLSVHSSVHLQSLASAAVAAGASGAAAGPAYSDPLLLLDCGMSWLHAVRWNPANENVVGVTSTASRQLPLYDLEHTQGRPKEVLQVPAQSASLSALGGSVGGGLTDLAFFSGGGSAYTLAAGGGGGQVFLWDQRARNTPRACLHVHGSGAVSCLQLAGGERLVVAGTSGGEVKVWDLRGGSAGTLRFGAAVHVHPLLDSVSLRLALAAVPGLADQSGIPPASVQWLQADPRDERRLGFHLGCGWSGVLDLQRHTISHLHAPPQHGSSGSPGGGGALGTAPAEFRPDVHRRACWAPDGSHLMVPSRLADAVHLLDCSPSRHAGCAVPTEAESSGGSSWGGMPGVAAPAPPAAAVQLSQPAICTAAHPTGDLLVAGCQAGRLALVGTS